MENWRVELTAGGKTLTEVKIQGGIFNGDAQSPLLFVVVMMPVSQLFRKCIDGYKLHKSQEKNNHLMYMADIKQLTKNEKVLETLIQTARINHQVIGLESGLSKYANNQKRQTDNGGRNRTTK